MDPWSSFPLGTDGLSARYCELNRLGEWLRQPANALSSLSYLAVGVATFARAGGRIDAKLRNILGVSLILLGLGSGSFHASITLAAQELDMAATYAVVLALTVHAISQVAPKISALALLVALVAADVLLYAIDGYRFGPWLLPLLLLVLTASAVWVAARTTGRSKREFVLAFVGLGVGGASWILDDRKVACAPLSVLQWHALWHLATAFGAWRLFVYFDRVAPAAAERDVLRSAA
jgi:hypothetical protein